jgi:GntR family transcriptional regulator, transcriptional repressor for pyruvate dehydrogenase complex
MITVMGDDLMMGAIERPPKTWVRVAERLQGLILGKKLDAGSKLPPERILCQQLGVSRTVLREAIKHLSAQGLVEEVTGRGTFVSKPNLEAVRKSLQICLGWHAQAVLENLLELRRLIEVEIAGLASLQATKTEIKDLWQNVAEMEAVVDGDTKRFMRLDLEFHAGLARATHNDLFVMLFDAIATALLGTWEKTHLHHEVREHGVRYHKKILTAIERRQPDEARRAVRENIDSFKRDVEAHTEQPGSQATAPVRPHARPRARRQPADSGAVTRAAKPVEV